MHPETEMVREEAWGLSPYGVSLGMHIRIKNLCFENYFQVFLVGPIVPISFQRACFGKIHLCRQKK